MALPIVEPCSRGLITAQPCPREGDREISRLRRRMVLAGCVLASSMAFIDGSALTVALPNLRAALGADLATVQWVLNGYMLALASLTLVGGALADTYGKAHMLSIGCILFAVTSAGCALAPSVALLVVVRVLQGVAAAVLTPASLALIGATYPKDERNQAIAVWAAMSALTTAAGPVLGGWLTETFGWQAVFWINPPLGLITVILLRIYAPKDQLERGQFDLLGAAIVAAALGTLAWALSEIGGERGSVMSTKIILVAGLGLVGLGAYAAWERVSDHPMTPPPASLRTESFSHSTSRRFSSMRDFQSCSFWSRSISSTAAV
jgi:MFS family permease